MTREDFIEKIMWENKFTKKQVEEWLDDVVNKEVEQQVKNLNIPAWKKPLIDRVKYELRRYTELAKRMDELMHECNLEADYSGTKEAEIKRNCYNRFVNNLKQLVS